MDAIKLVGIATRTTNACEMSGMVELVHCRGQFWSKQIILARFPQEPGTIYGCYSDYENGAMGEYMMLIGAPIDPSAEVPVGVDSIEIAP
ncbi:MULTISPECIES: hypothetical protein [Paenibacillus]|uniref:hypothetical protein n=1 Tax=Paenibacillus TaxID=44249 RepID=UPI00140D8817